MILKMFNLLFRIFLIFLICFVWVRYFVNNLSIALLYTSLLTLCIELIIHFILEKKLEKNKLKQAEEKLAEKISINFIHDPNKAINYYYKLCSTRYLCKKTKYYIEIKNELNLENASSKKIILFPIYSFDEISKQKILEIVRKIEKLHPSKLVICGYEFSKNSYELIKNFKDFKVIILDSKNCFLKLIKFYNYYPENLKEISFQNKTNFKNILKEAITKKRAKGYLFSALILLFSSFIVRLNIYYVIISTILLTLSLICLIFPISTKTFNEEIL